jgi:hypothetical protein
MQIKPRCRYHDCGLNHIGSAPALYPDPNEDGSWWVDLSEFGCPEDVKTGDRIMAQKDIPYDDRIALYDEQIELCQSSWYNRVTFADTSETP